MRSDRNVLTRSIGYGRLDVIDRIVRNDLPALPNRRGIDLRWSAKPNVPPLRVGPVMRSSGQVLIDVCVSRKDDKEVPRMKSQETHHA